MTKTTTLVAALATFVAMEANAHMCIVLDKDKDQIVESLCGPLANRIGTYVERDIRKKVVHQAKRGCGKSLREGKGAPLNSAFCGSNPVATATTLSKEFLVRRYSITDDLWK